MIFFLIKNYMNLFITKKKFRQQDKIKRQKRTKNGNNNNNNPRMNLPLIPTRASPSLVLSLPLNSLLSLSLCCCNSKYTKREKLVSLSLLFCWVSPMCVFFLSPLTLIYPLLFFFFFFFYLYFPLCCYHV